MMEILDPVKVKRPFQSKGSCLMFQKQFQVQLLKKLNKIRVTTGSERF